jgi:hypothetical protein
MGLAYQEKLKETEKTYVLLSKFKTRDPGCLRPKYAAAETL